MKVLLVGAGVIGTAYGANLAAAGDTVSVLAHGARTAEVAKSGLRARDVACICAALYRGGADTQRLGRDRRTLHLMCVAVTQGFKSLQRQRVNGLPSNLRVTAQPSPDASRRRVLGPNDACVDG